MKYNKEKLAGTEAKELLDIMETLLGYVESTEEGYVYDVVVVHHVRQTIKDARALLKRIRPGG